VKTVLINDNRQVGENARVPTWPKSAVRIGFGLIWLVDASFKFSPDFRTGILGMVKGAATGQPSWPDRQSKHSLISPLCERWRTAPAASTQPFTR
jgi:hypothetical protein